MNVLRWLSRITGARSRRLAHLREVRSLRGLRRRAIELYVTAESHAEAREALELIWRADVGLQLCGDPRR